MPQAHASWRRRAPPEEGSAEHDADLAEVKRLAGDRTAAIDEQVRKWSSTIPSAGRWPTR